MCLDVREHGQIGRMMELQLFWLWHGLQALGWNVVIVLYPVLLCIDLQIASLLLFCVDSCSIAF